MTFNANGGTGNTSPQTTNIATALTANTFTRTGYTFTGWNTAADGSGTSYADQATYPFTADTTLYAQWTALPNHTVTFNANGGTGSTSPQTTNVPTALTANAFTRTGYTFTGWNTAADGAAQPIRTEPPTPSPPTSPCTPNGRRRQPPSRYGALRPSAQQQAQAEQPNFYITCNHTTGTSTDQLLLVGVSWNSATNNSYITSVTFTPLSGSALPLIQAISQVNSWAYRFAAIITLPTHRVEQPAWCGLTSAKLDSQRHCGRRRQLCRGGYNHANRSGKGRRRVSASTSVTLNGLVGDERVFVIPTVVAARRERLPAAVRPS